jgi:cytochrome bd-type quinol oxidase subunit 2
MGVELFSWLIILTFFSLYGVLSGMELGVAITRIEPRLAPAEQARRMFTPRLEVTNVLLVLGALGLFWMFNSAAVVIVREMWPVLALGLLALVLRAGLLTYLVLSKSTPGGQLLNYLFALVSFVVPLTLGAAGIYMATGVPFWQGGVGATLFASLVVGLLALGAGFIYYVGGNKAPLGVVLVCRLSNIALAGILAIVLLMVLSGDSSHLLSLPYAYLAVIAAGIVLMQSAFMAANREWRMWWCMAALAVLAPFLMGLANYPYLIFPEVMIRASFAM